MSVLIDKIPVELSDYRLKLWGNPFGPGCLCANVLSDNFSVSQVYMFVLLIRSQLYVAAIIIVSLVKEILDLRGLTGFK